MPYIPDPMKEKEQAVAPRPGLRAAVSPGGVSSSTGGSQSPGGNNPTPAKTPFLNLQTYLSKNGAGGAAQAARAVAPVRQQGLGVKQGLSEQQGKFQTGVESNIVQGGQVQQEGVTAGSKTQTQGPAGRKWVDAPKTQTKQADGSWAETGGYWQDTPGDAVNTYTAPNYSLSTADATARAAQAYNGPSSLADADKDAWAKNQTAAGQVDRQVGLLGTQGGREGAIRQQNQGYMSPFERALSGYTMGEAGGGQIQDLRSEFQGLSGLLSQQNKASEGFAKFGKDFSEKNKSDLTKGVEDEGKRQTARWSELGLGSDDFRGAGGGATFDVSYEDYAKKAQQSGRPVATRAEWQDAKGRSDKGISDTPRFESSPLGLGASDFTGTYEQYVANAKGQRRPVATQQEWEAAKGGPK